MSHAEHISPAGTPVEHARRPSFLKEAILHRMHFREVLPAEMGIASQLSFQAYNIRTALRLGDEGSYIFDPGHGLDNLPVSPHRVALFAEYIHDSIRHFDNESLARHLFPDADPVRLNGIMRRLTDSRGFKREQLDDPEHVATALKVMDRELGPQPEKPKGKTAVIIAHTAPPDYKKLNDDLLGTHTEATTLQGKLKAQIGGLAQLGFMSTAAPYLGASVLAAELEENGFTDIQIMDYREIAGKRIEEALPGVRPDMAFIAGVTSFDAKAIAPIANMLTGSGIRTVVGGISPTIDPNHFLLATGADVMIGEAEYAVAPMLQAIDKAGPGERLVFTRQGYNPSHAEIAEGQVNGVATRVERLPVTPHANIEAYYSPERERGGQLASRIKYDYLMVKPMELDGKWWEAPRDYVEQMQVTRGCPVHCSFCSTSEALGHRMRRIPLETIDMVARASEAKGFLILDQNFPAQESDHNKRLHQQWSEYMHGFFSIMDREGKKVACQTDSSFADRLAEDPELARLVKKRLVAILIGLEQPVKLKSTGIRKTPQRFAEQLKIFRDLGIIVAGTAIPGLPPENERDERVTQQEFETWITSLPYIVPILFPAMRFRGTPNGGTTDPHETNVNKGYHGWHADDPEGSMMEEESLRQFMEITSHLYTPGSIARRFGEMVGRFSPNRLALSMGIHMMMAAAYAQGWVNVWAASRVQVKEMQPEVPNPAPLPPRGVVYAPRSYGGGSQTFKPGFPMGEMVGGAVYAPEQE